MLTLIALTALALQEPPAPPAPAEVRTRVMTMGPHGPDSLDKDGDGQVSREEFAAPMTDHFGRMDKDGDGRLSREELSAGHGMGEDHDVMVWRGAEGGPGEHRVEVRRIGDGPTGERTMVFVGEPGGETGERHVIVRGPGGHGAPRVIHGPGHGGPGGETRFEIRTLGGEGERHGPGEMDKDGDGRISEAEFTGPLRDAFALMDADRSGFIEEGERGGDGEVRVFTHRIETRDED
ncbi:EF-hand domain-containing protein [Roseibacterium beibuensis]|uniref:EF-hand domain-containing protein n=1 Tax=[Roseibacterium] beibuensis TaxID=1193142 RepID=UPI00217D7BE7|nr:EF-hand domain-containing protein [Roseibacterium beibuensis]MCS6622753.1 EF-hand domain-containing protein [Roseibacterium beibuensis]